MNSEELIKEAKKALMRSYSPYSKFPVGAAILCKDGAIFYGANIENASYGLSMCAERIAIYTAYNAGKNKNDIKAIAVVTKSKNIVTSCGACRQVISELCDENTPIYFANDNKKRLIMKVKDLLPHGINKEDILR